MLRSAFASAVLSSGKQSPVIIRHEPKWASVPCRRVFPAGNRIQAIHSMICYIWSLLTGHAETLIRHVMDITLPTTAGSQAFLAFSVLLGVCLLWQFPSVSEMPSGRVTSLCRSGLVVGLPSPCPWTCRVSVSLHLTPNTSIYKHC
jgi:hypothetical protein